jgi:hypothetical protein
MEKEESLYLVIGDKLIKKYDGIVHGKMMSSPGLKYKNKVFAFYHNQKMTFRLGKGFDISAHGIDNYSLLSPFKNKPPLAAWFNVSYQYQNQWAELAELALDKLKEEIG